MRWSTQRSQNGPCILYYHALRSGDAELSHLGDLH